MTHAVKVLTKRSIHAHPIEVSSDLSEDFYTSSTAYTSKSQHTINRHVFYPSAPILLSFHPESASGTARNMAWYRSLCEVWDTLSSSYDMRDAVYTALKLLFFALQCGWSTLHSTGLSAIQTYGAVYERIPESIRQLVPSPWIKPTLLGLLIYYIRVWLPFVPHGAVAVLTGITLFVPSTLLANNILCTKLVVVCLVVSAQLIALSTTLSLSQQSVWQFSLLLGQAAATCFTLQLFALLSNDWRLNLNRAWVAMKFALLLLFCGHQQLFWPLLMWLQKLQLICTLQGESQPCLTYITSTPAPGSIPPLPSTTHTPAYPAALPHQVSSHTPYPAYPVHPHHPTHTAHVAPYEPNSDHLSSVVSTLLCIACMLYVPPGELHNSPLIPDDIKWAARWAVHVLGLGTFVMLCSTCILKYHQHSLMATVKTSMSRKWYAAAAIVVLFAAPALLTQAGSFYGLDGGEGNTMQYAEAIMKVVSVAECFIAAAATLRPNGAYWHHHWNRYPF